jgi:F5/8 type C domain-containing protein
MLRKQIVPKRSGESSFLEGEIPIAAAATVQVTSEQADHPIDNAFDGNRGPGGSRWIASAPGAQTVILVFDSPQTIRKIGVETEELTVSRTQELSVSVSSDGGRTYRELVRQEFNFSPPGTSFERELWSVSAGAVTHLRLEIKPDKGDRVGLATLTSLAVA